MAPAMASGGKTSLCSSEVDVHPQDSRKAVTSSSPHPGPRPPQLALSYAWTPCGGSQQSTSSTRAFSPAGPDWRRHGRQMATAWTQEALGLAPPWAGALWLGVASGEHLGPFTWLTALRWLLPSRPPTQCGFCPPPLFLLQSHIWGMENACREVRGLGPTVSGLWIWTLLTPWCPTPCGQEATMKLGVSRSSPAPVSTGVWHLWSPLSLGPLPK